MAVTTSLRRECLLETWLSCRDSGLELLPALESAFTSARAAIKDGRFRTSVSGAGIQSSFASGLRHTPEDFVSAYSSLILDVYPQAQANVLSRSETATDSAIYAEMTGLLIPVVECGSDQTLLRA